MFRSTRTAVTLAAFALVLAAFAGLAALLLPNPGARAVEVPTAVVVEPPAPVEVDPFLAALMPGTEVTPERAEELLLAADRVCEGLTAGVPVTTIEQTLAEQLGITLPEAHDLLVAAAISPCSDPIDPANPPTGPSLLV